MALVVILRRRRGEAPGNAQNVDQNNPPKRVVELFAPVQTVTPSE